MQVLEHGLNECSFDGTLKVNFLSFLLHCYSYVISQSRLFGLRHLSLPVDMSKFPQYLVTAIKSYQSFELTGDLE